MNELKINGTQEFMGINIPIITGGFGEKCKTVLAKTVAEIHGVELKDINKLIKNNLDEFEIGVDLLDLCDDNFKVTANHLGFITSNGQKFCYILSEQGYIALTTLMRTDKAREIRKQFRRNYFSMVETIQNIISEIDMKILNIIHAESDVAKALAIRDFSDCVTKPLKEEIDKYERFLGDKLQPLTKTQLATKLDTNTITLAKLFKKLNIYTEKKCNVSENFISKFPKIKMIMETENTYKDTKTNTVKTKPDWQWTWDGAKVLIDYLVSVNKVSYCENSGFKLVKEN